MSGTAIPLGALGNIRSPETRLYSDGIVVGEGRAPLAVPPGSAFRRIEGTGFLDPESGHFPGALIADESQIQEARKRLADADLPGRSGLYRDMAEAALIDIETLGFPNGAVVAAASPHWRYVWPRDAAYVTAALALVGRFDDALRLIRFVAGCQEPDGLWQARYLPEAPGRTPDDRGLQLDGNGWVLWAAWVWARLSGADPAPLEPMIFKAVAASIGCLDGTTRLPGASQDYWEMDADRTGPASLGTAGPLLYGLRTGRDLAADLGHDGVAANAQEAADALAAAIEEHFGPYGYPRKAGMTDVDASVAHLLPPFMPGAPAAVPQGSHPSTGAPRAPAVQRAFDRAMTVLSVPNGGVRPGEAWPDRETAWNPQAGLFAMTAACSGDTALAHRLLSWLDVRRTRLGALPEKVTGDGRPAAPAPLGMISACVLIALAALEGRSLPIPQE